MTPLLVIVPGLQRTRVARRRVDCPLVFFSMVALAAEPGTTARGAGGGRAGSQENLKLAFQQGLGKEVRVEVDKGARVEVVEDEVVEHQSPPLASAIPSASSPM